MRVGAASRLLSIAALAAALLVPAAAAQAGDATPPAIAYDSRIVVGADGTLDVKDTIVTSGALARAAYVDLPTVFPDSSGREVRLRLSLEAVRRDGEPLPVRAQAVRNALRVALSGPSSEAHEYVLEYRVKRAIRFLPGGDELAWKLGGDFSGVPLASASVVVLLPLQVPRATIAAAASMVDESRRRDAPAAVDDGGAAVVKDAGPFHKGEGLLVSVTWPAGFVTPPTLGEKLRWMIDDNFAACLALLGLALVLAYELSAWSVVGRDPRGGAIMPVYEPPLSPAAMRYVYKKGFDTKAFAALVVSLAAKKYIEVSEDKGFTGTTYMLRRTGGGGDLAPEEADAMEQLFAAGDVLYLKANDPSVRAATNALQQTLAATVGKQCFRRNFAYLVPGLLLSAATFAVVVHLQQEQWRQAASFVGAWLAFWTAALLAMAVRAAKLWRDASHARGLAKLNYVGALLMSAFAVPFLAAEGFGLFLFAQLVSYGAALGLAAVVAVNLVFYHLLRAPTPAGRALMDQVAGFRMFLGATADPERGGVKVEKHVAAFESYLPYAMALDLEQRWTPRFTHALAAAASTAEDDGREPMVVVGPLGSLAGGAGGLSEFANSFTAALLVASTRGLSRPGSRRQE